MLLYPLTINFLPQLGINFEVLAKSLPHVANKFRNTEQNPISIDKPALDSGNDDRNVESR